jgi:hypothetical protein
MFVQTKEKDIIRDINTMSLSSTDTHELNKYKELKKKFSEMHNLKNEVASLKDDISEIKNMLKKVLGTNG